MNDLGQRRRAFRRREGEINYDLQARKAMERQERVIAIGGKYVWLDQWGSYNKVVHGPIGRQKDE